jgi:hypothetical protein
VVFGFDELKGRYMVRLDEKTELALKAANLSFAHAPPCIA